MKASPIRVQLKRSKGWKMPPNTIIVDRRSRWGNPFVVGRDGTAQECIRKYAADLLPYTHKPPNNGLHELFVSEAVLKDMEIELRGKNLACWCALDQPCHADLLLKWANESGGGK